MHIEKVGSFALLFEVVFVSIEGDRGGRRSEVVTQTDTSCCFLGVFFFCWKM